jgi:hypothetical protein
MIRSDVCLVITRNGPEQLQHDWYAVENPPGFANVTDPINRMRVQRECAAAVPRPDKPSPAVMSLEASSWANLPTSRSVFQH